MQLIDGQKDLASNLCQPSKARLPSPEVHQKKRSGAIAACRNPSDAHASEYARERKARKRTKKAQIRELKRKYEAQKVITYMLCEDFKGPSDEIITMVKNTRRQLQITKSQVEDAREINE